MSATSDWFPTSERLPENDDWILIRLTSGRYAVGRFVPKNNSWRTSGMSGPLSTKNVSHWANIEKPTK